MQEVFSYLIDKCSGILSMSNVRRYMDIHFCLLETKVYKMKQYKFIDNSMRRLYRDAPAKQIFNGHE
jgi:hypothetical protein